MIDGYFPAIPYGEWPDSPSPFGLNEAVVVIPPPILATYDLSSLVGQVRLLIADVDITNAIFSDGEINAALSLVGGTNIFLAGALLLESRANDASNTSLAMRLGLDTIDRTKIPTLLRQAAADLRRRTIGPILVNAPDQVFSTSRNGGNTPGTTDLW